MNQQAGPYLLPVRRFGRVYQETQIKLNIARHNKLNMTLLNKLNIAHLKKLEGVQDNGPCFRKTRRLT